MIKLSTYQLWVHDQNEALAFYTEKLGFEVRTDVTVPELGNFRWLTVGPAAQPDIAIVLMAIPGPPVMDEETAEQVRTLMGKGFAGTGVNKTQSAVPSLANPHPLSRSSARAATALPAVVGDARMHPSHRAWCACSAVEVNTRSRS